MAARANTPADPPRDRLGLRAEVARKAIHLATVGVPLAVWVLPRPAALALLLLGAALALATEAARTHVRWARHLFLRRTRRLLRTGERRGLAGATWMALSYLLAFLLLPLPVAVVAMLYNGLGDAAAAIVGKRWGRHRAAWGKSLEGAGAGALVNLAAGLVVPGVPVGAALAGAVAAAALEYFPLPFDDNVRVTLGGGFALWAAVALVA